MAKLYVANPTKQRQVIYYRLDFNKQGEREELRRFQPARQQDVGPGMQVQLGGDLHQTQIVDIVEQLGRYGLIGVVDVPRMHGRVTYVYNIDRPVPAEILRRVIFHNDAIMIADGRDRRAKAAVATNDIVQNTVANQFAQLGIDQRPADRTSVTFEQQEQSERGEKPIAEGYRVTPDGKGAPPPKSTRGRKATKPRAAA